LKGSSLVLQMFNARLPWIATVFANRNDQRRQLLLCQLHVFNDHFDSAGVDNLSHDGSPRDLTRVRYRIIHQLRDSNVWLSSLRTCLATPKCQTADDEHSGDRQPEPHDRLLNEPHSMYVRQMAKAILIVINYASDCIIRWRKCLCCFHWVAGKVREEYSFFGFVIRVLSSDS
jgi:hypothetical protein